MLLKKIRPIHELRKKFKLKFMLNGPKNKNDARKENQFHHLLWKGTIL